MSLISGCSVSESVKDAFLMKFLTMVKQKEALWMHSAVVTQQDFIHETPMYCPEIHSLHHISHN